MVRFEIIGISLVVISVVYAFCKKNNRKGLALIIVLLILLFLLGYFNTPLS